MLRSGNGKYKMRRDPILLLIHTRSEYTACKQLHNSTIKVSHTEHSKDQNHSQGLLNNLQILFQSSNEYVFFINSLNNSR